MALVVRCSAGAVPGGVGAELSQDKGPGQSRSRRTLADKAAAARTGGITPHTAPAPPTEGTPGQGGLPLTGVPELYQKEDEAEEKGGVGEVG